MVADFPGGSLATLTLATPTNQVYAAFLRPGRTPTSVSGAGARTFADFMQAGRPLTDHQDWHLTLPKGFVNGSC